ncbi:Protein of unknown function DUF1645 [Macleaya cordata]|uniref:Uncharacterized protein n=1 Tax=Macleaya cordata TaxID=56857 RepID=A0A200R2Q2_MACCD|nr:Protein of unknown function DUF1645 [Macleaya cordata]
MLQSSIFAQSPSFNSYSSNNFAEIADKVCEEFIDEREELGLEPVVVAAAVAEEESLIKEEESFQQSSDDLTLEQQQQEQEQAEEDSGNNEETDGDDDDDFEFTFVCRDPDGSPITADELFANGQIRPVFPIFNRDLLFAGGRDDDSKPAKSSTLRVPLKNLFLGDRDSTDPPSSSSSEADELENLPAGTYCVWTPKGSSSSQASPETCKKSSSTGSSSSRRWRLRDFLFRSNSDGKDTFVFLTPSASTKMKKKDEKAVEKVIKAEVSEERKHSGESKVAGKGKSKGVSTAAEVSPHEIHYVRNRALKENDRRRSYLPYRQDLVGFFANVNGLSRNLHPF